MSQTSCDALEQYRRSKRAYNCCYPATRVRIINHAYIDLWKVWDENYGDSNFPSWRSPMCFIHYRFRCRVYILCIYISAHPGCRCIHRLVQKFILAAVYRVLWRGCPRKHDSDAGRAVDCCRMLCPSSAASFCGWHGIFISTAPAGVLGIRCPLTIGCSSWLDCWLGLHAHAEEWTREVDSLWVVSFPGLREILSFFLSASDFGRCASPSQLGSFMRLKFYKA